MSEEKIITAKFQKNKFAQCSLWIGIILVILRVIVAFISHKSSTRDDIVVHILRNIFASTRTCFFCLHWDIVIIYIGIISLICFGISVWIMSNCSMEVTSNRVTGKASFGQTVDLPLSQISAVGLGIFKRITVATSSGKISFWWVTNRDDVRSVLLEQLIKLQQEKNNNQQVFDATRSADELKKFKELLDIGVITQEEFDAKKKQFLGL